MKIGSKENLPVIGRFDCIFTIFIYRFLMKLALEGACSNDSVL